MSLRNRIIKALGGYTEAEWGVAMDKLVEASKAEPSAAKAGDCSTKPKKKCRYNAEIGEYEELYTIPNPWGGIIPHYYDRMENWRRYHNAALQATAIAAINDVKKWKRGH